MTETSLHASLKSWYSQPGDQIETLVDGFIIDIRRGDLLIEVQTRSFSSLRPKLEYLLSSYRLHVVHPIAVEKWIVKKYRDKNTQPSRRKSPQRGRLEHMFKELIYISHLLPNPNLSVEIILTREEVVWVDDGTGSWRRKGWRIADRSLIDILERQVLFGLEDYRSLLPSNLPQPFTTTDLAERANIPRPLAQMMTYCMRKSGIIELNGKRKQAYCYAIPQSGRGIL